MKRLEYNASTLEEVEQYYQTRARQLLQDGFVWNKKLIPVLGGFTTTFTKNNKVYGSFYCLTSFRKGGHSSITMKIMEPIITTPNCNIIDFLIYKDIKHEVAGQFLETIEYKMVSDFYGNKKANRSQCWLMNHVDEGLYLLNYFKASESTKKAFCLHPLIQADEDLKNNWSILKNQISAEVLGLTLEYRNIANAYLAHRKIDCLEDIVLSPLNEVNDMLRADKVQNYKDFLIYHKETHKNNLGLNKYFINWLNKLDISKETFNDLFKNLKDIEISTKSVNYE